MLRIDQPCRRIIYYVDVAFGGVRAFILFRLEQEHDFIVLAWSSYWRMSVSSRQAIDILSAGLAGPSNARWKGFSCGCPVAFAQAGI